MKKFLFVFVIFPVLFLNLQAKTWLFNPEENYLIVDIARNPEGDFFLLGRNFPSNLDCDDECPYIMFVVKTDKNGVIKWVNSFNKSLKRKGNRLFLTPDGGCLIVGMKFLKETEEGIFLFKLNSEGKLVWEKLIDKGLFAEGRDIVKTKDGNLVVVGAIRYKGMDCTDVFVAKVDNSGNLIWKKFYGGIDVDIANAVVSTEDGGCVVAGYSFSFSPNYLSDFLIYKIDSKGNIVWRKTIGGKNNDKAYILMPTSDGNFLVGGCTSSYVTGGSYWDIYICKITPEGIVLWQKNYGGKGMDSLYSVFECADGNYLCRGRKSTSDKKQWFFKITPAGKLIWRKVVDTDGLHFPDRLIKLDNGDIVLGFFPDKSLERFSVFTLNDNCEKLRTSDKIR